MAGNEYMYEFLDTLGIRIGTKVGTHADINMSTNIFFKLQLWGWLL
jgi:hypothetical protein